MSMSSNSGPPPTTLHVVESKPIQPMTQKAKMPSRQLVSTMAARRKANQLLKVAQRMLAKRSSISNDSRKLFELANNCQPVITVANTKGGSGKTAVAVWLAVLLQETTKRQVIVVDCNENGGTTATRLGVSRRNVTLHQLVKTGIQSAQALNLAMARHPSGVSVISSEITTEPFDEVQLRETIDQLRLMGYIVILDTGNNISGTAGRVAVTQADVLVFPATIRQPESFDAATQTMRQCISNLPQKVVFPLLGVGRKQAQQFTRESFVDFEQLIPVPVHKSMAEGRVPNRDKLSKKAQSALLRLAKQCMTP